MNLTTFLKELDRGSDKETFSKRLERTGYRKIETSS